MNLDQIGSCSAGHVLVVGGNQAANRFRSVTESTSYALVSTDQRWPRLRWKEGIVCAAIDPKDMEDGFLGFCWQNLAPEARARVLAKSSKTFWLFGAGASHHYSLNAFGVPVPLASGFFRAYHQLPISQGFDSYVGPLNNFLQEYRGVTPETVGEFDENIEAFMTSVESELELIRETARDHHLSGDEFAHAISYAMVFTNMNFIFANVLNEAQNGPSMSLYRAILELCGPNDLFVTFNWDTLLDRALLDTGGWNPNTGYGLTFRAVLDGSWKNAFEGDAKFPTNWKLLKLHGSTNWLVPYMGVDFRNWEFQTAVAGTDDVFLYWYSSLPYATHKNRWRGGYVPPTYGYYPPNLPADCFTKEQLSAPPGKMFVKATYRFFSPFEEDDPTGSIPSSPILITPVRQKKYDIYKATIQSLWSQAVKGLEDASRIVIIGYSFPPTDTRALDLFRGLLAARGKELSLEIVAPDVGDIAKRIGEDYLGYAKEVKLHKQTFEEYAEMLSESMPSLMRQAAAEDPEVQVWLERMYISSKRRKSNGKAPIEGVDTSGRHAGGVIEDEHSSS